MIALSLVPRFLPAFQCCTLKSKRAWYLIARDCHATVQSMGRVENRSTYCRFLKPPFTSEYWLCRVRVRLELQSPHFEMVRLLGIRKHVSHVQLDIRLPRFLCVTLKNWEEPGDEARLLYQSMPKRLRPSAVWLVLSWRVTIIKGSKGQHTPYINNAYWREQGCRSHYSCYVHHHTDLQRAYWLTQYWQLYN